MQLPSGHKGDMQIARTISKQRQRYISGVPSFHNVLVCVLPRCICLYLMLNLLQ